MKPLRCALPLLLCTACHGAVTLDGSFGTGGPLAGPAYAIPAVVGRQVGGNLFHSFTGFSIASGESATFSGPASVANVIARVTGGGASAIDGLLRSTIAGANLYLLNPAGVLFGPHASLDVGGSFYASSAHSLRLADAGRFEVATPAASVLTAAAPAAFGFLGPVGAIAVDRSQLAVPAGRTLALVGGDVAIGGVAGAPRLTAAGGQIVIAAVAGAGEVVVGSGAPDIAASLARGNVTLSGNTTLDVRTGGGAAGGSVMIRAGRFVMTDSSIDARTVNGNGGMVDIDASGDLLVSGQGSSQSISSVTTGAGNAGAIVLTGANIIVSNAAQIDSSADPGGSGRGGRIDVRASGSINIAGRTAINSLAELTGVVSNTFGAGNAGALSFSAPRVTISDYATVQSQTAAGGNAGSIGFEVGTLEVRGGAQIQSASAGAGAGGAVNINATGAVTIAGSSADGAFISGVFADAFSTGTGGTVNLAARSLILSGGGEISSSSRAGAAARGGDVHVSVDGGVVIAGASVAGQSRAIAANTFGAGNAGTIDLAAGKLAVSDRGRIQSQSEGAGNGGEIRLALGGLQLAGGGQISADTRQGGRGGSVDARVAGDASISGADSGLFANAYLSGASGNLRLDAGSLTLADGGGLFAFSQGAGRAGDVVVNAGTVAMRGGARISVQSFGSGDAGSISLDGGASLTMQGSAISTEARLADGGNITIRARDLIVLQDSRITATVGTGLGNGGNIAIDPALMVLNHSDIIANAFGGNGGNISIAAGQFFRSPDSAVSASSQLGISGSVVIRSPIADLSGALAALPVAYLDSGALLSNACAARLAGRASSLVLAGRGGLPAAPDRPFSGMLAGLAAAPQAEAPTPTVRPWSLAAAARPLLLACAR